MRRKIKFRKWCPLTKRFRHSEYTGYWNVGIDDEHFLCRTNDDEMSQTLEPEHPIQQFTGLLDVDRREIYEGDIVKLSDLNYVILWNEYEYIATCPNYQKYHWPMLKPFSMVRGTKIVGNIFENPELVGSSFHLKTE